MSVERGDGREGRGREKNYGSHEFLLYIFRIAVWTSRLIEKSWEIEKINNLDVNLMLL